MASNRIIRCTQAQFIKFASRVKSTASGYTNLSICGLVEWRLQAMWAGAGSLLSLAGLLREAEVEVARRAIDLERVRDGW